MYLPGKLIPENIHDMPFEDFLKLLAMAEIARDLRIEDIEVGVNKGYVEAHPDSQLRLKRCPGYSSGIF